MLIAGIDEAGRGPAIGPMVLAIALIDADYEESLREMGAKDSKEVPVSERERLYPLLQKQLHHHATISLFPGEMDILMDRLSLNEIEAMKAGHLLNNLPDKPDLVYVDSSDPLASHFARRIRSYLSYPTKIIAEHKADVNYPIVSAASILAKVERDAAIKVLQEEFHSFGDIGSGYPHDARTIKFLQEYL
ncbi:MAG: ribonuclease HII, partial [archaeon]|nr:ribonuclease HII [archaeon]